jgi:WD40 repeat protein
MSHERRAYTLTLLPNGKVMAVGGADTNGPLAYVELYDPTTGVWTSTSSLLTPRSSHTATLLPNGKVLVVGGDGPTESDPSPVDPVLASAEIYDPATGNWTPASAMGQSRAEHTATLLPSGKVLIAGGVSYFGSVFPTSAELYDSATGNWSPTLPLVSGHMEHVTALLPGGKVLLAGGFNSTDTGASTELYDPAAAVPSSMFLTEPRRLANGAFQFSFRNTPGLSFRVLSATNLALPLTNWLSLGAAAEITPGHYRFIDLQATQNPMQFYRVTSP